MRLGNAAALSGVDRKDLERWVDQGLVTFTQSNRQRLIVHTELAVLRTVAALTADGFTPPTAFEVARYIQAKPPTHSTLDSHFWKVNLSERTQLIIKQPRFLPLN